MNGAQLSFGFSHYLRRLTRQPLGPLIFVITPVVVISVLTIVLTSDTDQEVAVQGYNLLATYLSINMMILFQLNGGLMLLDYSIMTSCKP